MHVPILWGANPAADRSNGALATRPGNSDVAVVGFGVDLMIPESENCATVSTAEESWCVCPGSHVEASKYHECLVKPPYKLDIYYRAGLWLETYARFADKETNWIEVISAQYAVPISSGG